MEGGSLVSELLIERLNYCIYVILLLIGLWAMLAKRNLVKKLIGMSIFQTAIILFYVSFYCFNVLLHVCFIIVSLCHYVFIMCSLFVHYFVVIFS